MPNDNQNKQKLYNGLKEDGKFTGTYEEFSIKFADTNNRQFLYDGLLEDGDYTGSIEDFNNKYFQDAPQQTGIKKNTEETQMQTQGEEVPPQSNTKSPNYVGDFFSQFSTVDDIANYANVVDKKKTPADKYDLVGKSRSDISKLAQAEAMSEEEKASLNKGFQRSNDIQREELQKENDEKGTISNSYGKRTDGTEKGKGNFGEIPILSGDEKGKIATEKSISIEVDGKEILIPTIVPTLSSEEISFIQSGGNVLESPEIKEKAIAHAFKRMDEGKSPFATAEDRQIKTTTLDEDGKLKEVIIDLDASPYIEQKTVKDLDPTSIIQKIDPDDIKAATGQPNTYEVGTDEFYSYGQKQLNAKQFNTKVDEWNKSTGLGVEEYLNWQTKEQEVYGDMLSKYNESMSNTEWDTDPNVRREQSQTEWDMSLSKYDSERNAKWDAFIKEYEQKQADETSLSGQNKEDYLKRLNYLADYVLTNTITGKGTSFLMGAGAYLGDTWKYGEGDDRVRYVGETYRSIQQQATEEMNQYAPDNALMEGCLMTIGLGIDTGVFRVLGGISGGANKAVWNVFSKTLNRMGIAEPMAKLSTLKYLQKLSPAINKIPTIAQSATESAGLLGMYDGITDFTDKLKTKKVSELTRDDLLESFHATGRGYAGGLAIGTLGGVSNNVLQRVNSKAIQSMYPTFSMEARKIGAAKLPLKYRAIATGTFVGTGLFEFGVIFPASHATYDYVVGGDKEAFKHITWESALEEGIKGFLAIKMQHMPNLKATTKDVEWKGKFNSEIKYDTYELRSLGVKDYMELKQKVESPEFRKSAMESDKVPVSTKNKLIYDNTGYMNKATVPIDKTSIEIIDNEICLVSSTKDNVLVDVTPMESMSQAKLLEGISANLNLVDGVVRKSSKLDYEGSNNINAFYEKSPEKLMALNDALAKEMKDKTASDYQVIKEADMLLDKEVEAMAKRTEPIKEKITKEAPKTEVKTEPKVEVDIKETETTKKEVAEPTKEGEFKAVEVEGKEYQVKLKEDGTHEIKTTNDTGLEIPLRTAEGNNEAISKKVIEKFEGKVEPKTDVEVKEQVTEQPKAETKEPVKEYAAKVEETAEVKSEKVIFTKEELAKEKDKQALQTLTETSKDLKSFSKGITRFLKDNRKQGKLSDTKYNSLINRISESLKATKKKDGTIITPEQKKAEIAKYVAESLAEAAIRKDQSIAIKQQKQAKKLIKNKDIGFGDKSLDGLKALDIDLSTLTPEQVMQFNETVGEMLKSKNRQTPESIDKFVKELNDIIWTPKERKASTKEDAMNLVDEIFNVQVENLADYKSAKNKLRKLATIADRIYKKAVEDAKGTPEQQEKQIETAKMEREEILDYIESKSGEISLKDIVEGEGEVIKQSYLDNISETTSSILDKLATKENTGLDKATNERVENIVQELKNKDVQERLKVEDVELIDYALNNINNGFFNGQTQKGLLKAADVINTTANIKALEKVKNNKKTKKLIEIKKLEDVKNKFRTSNDYRIDEQMFGSLSHDVTKAVFNENMVNYGKSKQFVTETFKPLDNAFRGLKKEKMAIKKGDKLTDVIGKAKQKEYKKSIDLISILKTEKAWQNNKQKDLNTGKVYEPTDITKPESMQNYWDSAFERVPSTKVRDGLSYERTKNVWNELKQNPDNFNKDGSLNIDKVYENLSPAEKKVFNEIDNYNKIINEYVEMAAIKHGRIHNPINEYDFFHESYEIGDIKSNPETFLQNLESSYQSPTKQAGSTYDRDMGARIIRTDIDNVIKKQLEQVAHDMYVRDNLLSTWRSLDNAAKEVEGFDMITEALKTTLGERLIRAEGKEMLQGDTKSLDNLMTYMSYKFLGRVGRIPQELISNVDRALISEFSKDVVSNVEPVYQNMLTDYIVDTKDYSQFSENLSKTTNLGKKAINEIVVFADKKIAPGVFKSAFNKSFEKSTGNKFNPKEYAENTKYGQENYAAIKNAKTDGIIRVQELYNSKSALGSATHVMMFNRAINKRSIAGKATYFLQSFNHNEFNQMVRANKMMFGKGNSSEMRAEGLRDVVSLVSSNMIYMQAGILISQLRRSYIQQLADEDNPNPVTAFEDGLYDYWKANFANREVAAVSAMKTLVSLAAGKYDYFVQSGGSILLGFVQKDKDLDPKVKEALLEQGKGMYIEPVDITSSGYGSAKMYAQLHPILMEAVNAADVIEAGTESFGITEDNSELNIPMFINSVIRYAYVNPVSNAIDKWIKDYERAKGKKEKDSKSNSKGNSNTSGSKGKNTP